MIEQSWQKLGTFLEIKYFKNQNIQNIFFIKNWSSSPIFFKKKMERFNQFSKLKNDFENKNFEIFEEFVHNFGKSDGEIIQWTDAYFHYTHYL